MKKLDLININNFLEKNNVPAFHHVRTTDNGYVNIVDLLVKFKKFKENSFIEYTDNGEKYKQKEREYAQEDIKIRLYCNHKNCKQYIKGVEGYNGQFTAETGMKADLRNSVWICQKHDKNN